MLAAGNVHFVDIDVVDRCAGDGCVEASKELLKALILAAAEHGDGLAKHDMSPYFRCFSARLGMSFSTSASFDKNT